MGLFDSFGRKRGRDAEPAPHRGYYALHDGLGPDPDDDDDEDGRDFGAYRPNPRAPAYDEWYARLGHLDGAIESEERRRLPWWRPGYWRDRRKRWWAVRIVAAAIGLFIVLVAWLAITAPLNKSLEPVVPPQITLLAADGTPIARNGAIVDDPVKIATLPPHVVEAFLAVEDRRFYSHWGIDPRGIARAAWTGYGGGSTITQQLAKFTFLTSEQTLTRKAREMLIAFWLESWLTKDEILERYLSNAYFGDNVYGLRAASMHFFYRKPENRFVAEFIGRANFLPIKVVGNQLQFQGRPLSGEPPPNGSDYSWMLRPESLRLGQPAEEENSVTGRLIDSTFVGPIIRHQILLGDDIVVTVEEPSTRSAATPKGDVSVCWSADSGRLLPKEMAG